MKNLFPVVVIVIGRSCRVLLAVIKEKYREKTSTLNYNDYTDKYMTGQGHNY
jgi:hypothetical protein